MKIHRILIITFSLLLVSIVSSAQDKRTLETRVADLLARMPANDQQFTDKLMVDMLTLGETGMKQICDQVIPSGTGDDTRPRYAVESLSRFLSGKNYESNKPMWERICIYYATTQNDFGVKDFFMKQLQLFGGIQSANAVKVYLSSKEICNPALGVISAVGGKTAETILAESLKSSAKYSTPTNLSVNDSGFLHEPTTLNSLCFTSFSAIERPIPFEMPVINTFFICFMYFI